MRPLPSLIGAAVLLALPAAAPATADDSSPSSFQIKDPRIAESSGLAASRAHPGVYWTHNDSSDGPYVYAVDSRTGKTVARIAMRGIGKPRDVEAVSVGPDGNVYVGDIGDNLGGQWPHVWIYRFPEPRKLRDMTVKATQFTVQYQGGPRNAEAMMVHPKTGKVYIASKSDENGGLYEGPDTLSPSGVNVFRRIAPIDMEVTDGAFAPDGSRLVLRGYFTAAEYRWRGGKPKELEEEPGLPLQRQGESVTFSPDGGTLMYGTEGRYSRVSAEALDGELLPDATAKEQKRNGGGTAGSHAERSEDDKDRTLMKVALTFGGALVLLLGARRLFRRR
ncbi:hypothetical protein HUT19_23500 [Streptomyces sp. NA02950]|uniref:hypothetical protein n=1 Tax=Streptomyces sp. NA02950 TaxID=2742137 RepID=UPI001590CCDB|nr:hypothetical protein [Streptomyces sp. NA02950]QKV94355.1 hypothetical protein HUT19_23500 [Streptomyces sp. NA02950]